MTRQKQRTASSSPPPKKRKQGNGLGTKTELPDGRYRWQITVGFDQDNNQKRVSGTAENKTAAQLAIQQALTDHARGQLVLPNKITVKEYALRWLERQKSIADSTRESYKAVLGYAFEQLGNSKITEVKTLHVRDALAQLADRPALGGLGTGRTLSSRTLTQIRRLLRAVFREALEDGLIHKDPTVAVKRVKVDRTEHPGIALDIPEVARFQEIGEALYAAGLCRLWAALFTALNTGLRRGEVMGLRWQDIDLEHGLLNVRQNLTVNLGKPILKQFTKTQAGQRTVPIPDSLKQVLERHRAWLEVQLSVCGVTLSGKTPVFATAEGNYTHPDNLARALRDLLDWSNPGAVKRNRGKGKTVQVNFQERLRGVPTDARAQLELAVLAGEALPRISPHDLRHTCGTLWLRNDVRLEVVSKWLGHADIGVTLRIYRHVLPSETRAFKVDFFEAAIPVRAVRENVLNWPGSTRVAHSHPI